MLFTAVGKDGAPVEDAVFYSTGGGFVASEQELLHPAEPDREPFPSPTNPRRNCCAWRTNATAPFPPS